MKSAKKLLALLLCLLMLMSASAVYASAAVETYLRGCGSSMGTDEIISATLNGESIKGHSLHIPFVAGEEGTIRLKIKDDYLLTGVSLYVDSIGNTVDCPTPVLNESGEYVTTCTIPEGSFAVTVFSRSKNARLTFYYGSIYKEVSYPFSTDYTFPSPAELGFTLGEGTRFNGYKVDATNTTYKVGEKTQFPQSAWGYAIYLDVSDKNRDNRITVTNGSASAFFAKWGETVTLTADPELNTAYFDHWEVTSGDATITNHTSPNATMTMGYDDVTVVAVYNAGIITGWWSTSGHTNHVTEIKVDGQPLDREAKMMVETNKNVTVVLTPAEDINITSIFWLNKQDTSDTNYMTLTKKLDGTYEVTFAMPKKNIALGIGTTSKQYEVLYYNNPAQYTYRNYQYNSSFTVPSAESFSFTAPEGMHFKEWNESAYGNGKAYNPSETYNVPDKGYTALYAIWEQNVDPTVTVTFNMKGHGTAPATQTVERGSYAAVPAIPTADGYDFGGWYKDSACTVPFSFGNDAINSNTTIYAKWTAHTHEYFYQKSDAGHSKYCACGAVTPLEKHTFEILEDKNDQLLYRCKACDYRKTVKKTEAQLLKNTVVSTSKGGAVSFKTNVTVTAKATNVPSGYVLAVYVNGKRNEVKPDSGKTASFSQTIKNASADITVKAVIEKNGTSVVINNNLAKTYTVTVKNSFLDKMLAFFTFIFDGFKRPSKTF